MGWLDSIRAIAALLVVFQHYFYDRFFVGAAGSIYLQSQYEIFRALNFGKIGVVVFFFISGVIIPMSLLQKKNEMPLVSFAIARFFRLYPAYWVSVILAAVAYAKLGTPQFYFNLTMVQQSLGVENLLGLYWTLQIELIFYVICGYLFYRGWLGSAKTSIKMFALTLVAALVVAVLRAYLHRALPVAIPLSLAVMFLGTAFYWQSIQARDMPRRKFRFMLLSFFIVLLPICLLAYREDTGFSERWHCYYLSYLTAAGLFLMLVTRFKISNKILMYLGVISYSIYLFHPLCGVRYFAGESGVAVAMNMLLSVLASILAASIMYFVVERPGQGVGKRVRVWLADNYINSRENSLKLSCNQEEASCLGNERIT